MSASEHPSLSYVPSVAQIVAAVEAEFNVPERDMMSQNRTRTIVIARHVAAFACRRLRSMSFPELAKELWFREHSGVMYACERVARMIADDDLFRARVLRVELDALHRAQRAAHGRGWA